MDLEMHPRRKPMRSVSSMDMSDSFIEALVTIPKQRFWDSAPGFWMIWHSLTKCHDNWDSLTQTNTQNINLSVECVSTCLCFNSNNVLEQPRTLNHLKDDPQWFSWWNQQFSLLLSGVDAHLCVFHLNLGKLYVCVYIYIHTLIDTYEIYENFLHQTCSSGDNLQYVNNHLWWGPCELAKKNPHLRCLPKHTP